MGQNDDMTILSPDPNDSDKYNQAPKEEPADSGFQEAPKFETSPVYSEPPRPTEVPGPTSTPVYGEVVEPPKKNNRTLWIIIAVVVAVICCCCVVTIVVANNLFQQWDIQNLDDFMNEFSSIVRLVPALI